MSSGSQYLTTSGKQYKVTNIFDGCLQVISINKSEANFLRNAPYMPTELTRDLKTQWATIFTIAFITQTVQSQM